MTTELDLASLRLLAVGVAYRMVGSRTDAEDLAQEAMLRVRSAAAIEPLRSPEAFTTTVTTRLAIDHLRLSRVQRESYIGPWLPEPVADDPWHDPSRASELADSLSFALLVVLDQLTPDQRAAFLLHDAFGLGYAEVAEALDRSEAACRQLVVRARRKVAAGRPRGPVDPVEHRQLLERFVAAARAGAVDDLMALLTADAVLVSDGGPEVKAARHPIVGAHRVTRFLRRAGPRALGAGPVEVTPVNGHPGFVVRLDVGLHLVGTIEVTEGRICAIHWVLNRDKLRWVDPRR